MNVNCSRSLVPQTAASRMRLLVAILSAMLVLSATTACDPQPPSAPAAKFGFADNGRGIWGAEAAGQFRADRTNGPMKIGWARRIVAASCADGWWTDVVSWVDEVRAAGLTPVVTPDWDQARQASCPTSNYWSTINAKTKELYDHGVRYWTSLNEPDHKAIYSGTTPKIQPQALVNQWIAQRAALDAACTEQCLFITGEFATPKASANYVSDFMTRLRGAINGRWSFPMTWSIHDYGDVSSMTCPTQNYEWLGACGTPRWKYREKENLDSFWATLQTGLGSYPSQPLEALLPRIWITEAGVWLRTNTAADSPTDPYSSGGWLPVSFSHDYIREAAHRFLRLVDDWRIDRAFYFQWQVVMTPGPQWDSALVDNTGWHRPSYCVLKGIPDSECP